jgi:hypothetical protein
VTKRRHKRKRDNEATILTRSDKLKLAAWSAVALLVFFGFIHLVGTRTQAAALDRRIERWRIDYHVDNEQAVGLRAIENGFHGSGNPFTLPAHTMDEVHEHHRALARVMNPEDGARFLAAQQSDDHETHSDSH